MLVENAHETTFKLLTTELEEENSKAHELMKKQYFADKEH
jgi:hypothetical protein